MPSDFDADECPICFEVDGGEILQLQHTSIAIATTTHKACLSCRILLKESKAPCPWCRDTVLYVASGAALRPTVAATPAATEEKMDSPELVAGMDELVLPEGIKQSPCCGILVQRISGSAEMMCGCEAKPAGGNLFKALRGGGCGHEWNWDTLAAIAFGAPGAPAHPRQSNYGLFSGPRPDVPQCTHGFRADEECAQCPPPWTVHGGGGGGGVARVPAATATAATQSKQCCTLL